jgi:Flp pilus assembly pilin Flp
MNCFNPKSGRCGFPACGPDSAQSDERRPALRDLLARLWKGEEGQDLLEYALLIALIVLVAAVSISPLGSTIKNIFTSANTCLTTGGASCTGT